MATKKPKAPLNVETFTHDEANRLNIPTAEQQALLRADEAHAKPVKYPRNKSGLKEEAEGRNRDLDPQLIWRGKDLQNDKDFIIHAPPIYIQEKVHPKVLIEDLKRLTTDQKRQTAPQVDLFADFNGLPSIEARTEFYQHDAHWQNRMILGDSLSVMASLAEREGLRGKVQCIYFDPPYGIKFNSNFQWSTTSRDVKDGNAAHITREPEQVKAFRDTWRDGIHSYLSYIRDRLTLARDLLTESGSIFVQIGDENVHRVRAVMDEVFGDGNFVSLIPFVKTTSSSSDTALGVVCDYLIWFSKTRNSMKYRSQYQSKELGGDGSSGYDLARGQDGIVRRLTKEEKLSTWLQSSDLEVIQFDNITSSRPAGDGDVRSFEFCGKIFSPGKGTFKTDTAGLKKLTIAGRLGISGNTLRYVRRLEDFPVFPINSLWTDTTIAGFAANKQYIVETSTKVVQRCLLLCSDPGDLVLDPTCGSGTAAYVAEQWGRRWITIDTSRVALALARARIMGARYPYYLLADSTEGQQKEAELKRSIPSSKPTYGDIRHGFVYERVPHITLKSIANNTEIDVIWEKFQEQLEPLREALNLALKKKWQEWEIPREEGKDWTKEACKAHQQWWAKRIARQKEIDASIAAKADTEYLFDKPYIDKKAVRVAGPFTVESLSPHRMLTMDEDGTPKMGEKEPKFGRDFTQIMLDTLRTSGVQQAKKSDKIMFTSLAPWPGDQVCASGIFEEASVPKRAAIFIGPEFGTVTRVDLVSAAREASEANFDVLIACAFNFDAHGADYSKMGRLTVLKARMNADLHMAEDLKNTGKGNLFVIFGEPDIEIRQVASSGSEKLDALQVKVLGVDVFDPSTGEVRSDNADGIACWFVDTDYDEESFFVRHAYFLGANDPYKSLKTTLKAEVNEEAWESLNSDTSRPFPKPKSGRIAVKVINHLGDEVMKVFRV
jgi:adenine-specific DNA-methyltransferase